MPSRVDTSLPKVIRIPRDHSMGRPVWGEGGDDGVKAAPSRYVPLVVLRAAGHPMRG